MVNPKFPKKPKVNHTPVEISITVTRTAQPRRFESVTVSLTERHTLEPDEDPVAVRNQIYRQITERVEKYSASELKKYASSDDEGED